MSYVSAGVSSNSATSAFEPVMIRQKYRSSRAGLPVILSAFLLVGCVNRSNISNIQLISYDESSITVDADATQPEYGAIYHLLFRGLPNSNQTVPIISTSEEQTKQQFPPYFKTFIDNKRYQTFITSSTKNSNGSRRIVINTKALKQDLEQNSIIRKFGY